jgi:uridine kinase
MNFDHPRAIDWEAFHQALVDSRAGRSVHVPHYDFASHTRLPVRRIEPPRPLVIVDGLWLFLLPSVRECFDLRIFLNCPEQLRLEQRLARDLKERGRSPESVREQFWRTVAPMHNRYVRRQACLADVVLNQPPSEQEIRGLENMIRARLPDNSLLVETLSGQPSLIGSPMDAVAYQSRTIPF